MTGAQNFIDIHADEPTAVKSFGAVTMRTIKTTTGATITLDGDLLAVMEALYQEVTARRGLERTFEDMVREIPTSSSRWTTANGGLTWRRACSQHGEGRERQARKLHEETDEEVKW